jgi:hypothetical protein
MLEIAALHVDCLSGGDAMDELLDLGCTAAVLVRP